VFTCITAATDIPLVEVLYNVWSQKKMCTGVEVGGGVGLEAVGGHQRAQEISEGS